ncbi:FAD-binding oxidoreductase [Novosphingobium pituita]|nr:2Fe-2S iron-sulfur cluster-binding protein [Novosphingobium sp. IK01]
MVVERMKDGMDLTCDPAARWWDRETDADLVCLAVHDETPDIRTFTFAGAQGQSFALEAGQYFTFDVPLESGEGAATEPRCYSLSSSALRPRTIAVSVKRVPGGRVSNRLHEALRVGDTIRAMGPSGAFTLPRPLPEKLLLLSAGSGITPMIAMARTLADAAARTDVVFFHAARSLADFAFAADLQALARANPRFRVIFLPEDGSGGHFGPVGRISAELLGALVPDLAARTVLCCGPAPFMAAARAIGVAAGVPQAAWLEESFDLAPVESTVDDAPAKTGFSATFSRQNRTITVGADQTLLSAARAQGVVLPSSCANGLCGTCKARLVSGQVAMAHNGGIRQREIDAGFILPCCARPLTDVVIER